MDWHHKGVLEHWCLRGWSLGWLEGGFAAVTVSGSLPQKVKMELQVAMGGFALVVMTIRWFVWSGILVALEETLEVYKVSELKSRLPQ